MLSGVSADSFTAELLSHQPVLKSCGAAEFRQLLSAALTDHVITIPRFENQLRKLVATITEPAGKMSVLEACEAVNHHNAPPVIHDITVSKILVK